jgi:hypothetical protein
VSVEPGPSFATLTHARLRAAQGDIRGAMRILQVVLEVQPDHTEARELLDALKGRAAVIHSEPTEGRPDAVVPATTNELARRFRTALGGTSVSTAVARLSRWRERIDRNRGVRHVR